MKIYTKQGDDGGTGLVGGQRVSKDDARIEAYGTLDELSASLGWAQSLSREMAMDELIQSIQNDLFLIGSQLATPDPSQSPAGAIDAADVERLERAIDHWDGPLPPLRNFILPGGTPAAAALHVTRVVCRRAERRVVTLAAHAAVAAQIIPYLNRLSDLLFVLARNANAKAQVSDILWQPRRAPDPSQTGPE